MGQPTAALSQKVGKVVLWEHPGVLASSELAFGEHLHKLSYCLRLVSLALPGSIFLSARQSL